MEGLPSEAGKGSAGAGDGVDVLVTVRIHGVDSGPSDGQPSTLMAMAS